jgi:hypothetical protein
MLPLPISESYWVAPNRFLAGEYPSGYNLATMRQRIDAFLKSGVNAFFDLTQPRELAPYEAILKEQARIYEVNATYQRFAIRDHDVPSRETMTTILDALDAALNEGRNIYVHCFGGVGRTGSIVACHLIRRGKTPAQALAQVEAWFKTMPKHIYFRSSPETDVQIQFVRNWREI